MSQSSGYTKHVTRFILQDEVSLDPESRLRKMQICKTGKFYDPRYGNFEITKAMLSDMVDNFRKGVRGVVPALDYKHESDDIAAGWFKELFTEFEGSELWAKIEMTPKGEKVLSDKEFGYISAEFEDGYVDNETKQKHGCVLLGAGLTNRPVLKRMNPVIELSEEEMGKIEEMEKELAAMKKKLSDYEDMQKEMGFGSPDEMKKKFKELMEPQEKKMEPEMEPKKDKELSEPKKGEKEVDNKELEQTKIELAETKKKLALVEKGAEFNKLLSEGKVCEAQRESFIEGDMAAFVEKAVPVKLHEQGSANAPKNEEEGKDVEQIVLNRAKKLSEEKKIDETSAIVEVLKADKKLADKYYGNN